MKVKIEGQKSFVNLTNNDFLAKGGEGELFCKNSIVYKICEPGKMIPVDKIKELSNIDNSLIIRPKDVVLDEKNNPIGYTMDYISDTYVLCQIFPKAFKKRNGVTSKIVWELIQNMQKTTSFIHKNKGYLIVDFNELNLLVDKKFKNIYFIDVNSYQTPNYPATAIMDSVRDRHCNNKFNENTDWFSFGIISFQMMIGIHPFKGKHPSFTNLKTSMDERMKANISVLNSEVSFPKGACESFNTIPKEYLEWYHQIFDKGLRLPPPGIAKFIIAPQFIQKITGSNNFSIIDLYDFKEEILDVLFCKDKEVVLTNHSIYLNRMRKLDNNSLTKFGFTKNREPIVAQSIDGSLKLINLATGSSLKCSLNADEIMSYDGRIYIKNGCQILELEFNEIGSDILTTTTHVSNVLEQAAQIFEGVIVENLFESYYFSIYPEKSVCRQISIKELNGYKIIDAKFDKSVLVVVGVKNGQYDRFVFCFDKEYKKYSSNLCSNITYSGINFIVLDNNICILLTEDGMLEVFKTNDPTKKKSIDDKTIDLNMKLISKENDCIFFTNQKLYQLKMK